MTKNLLILALSIVLIYILQREFFGPEPTTDPEIAKSRVKIDSLKASIASLQDITDTLTLRLEKDSVEQAEQALKFKSKISTLTKKLAEKRPEIEPLLDSIPKLAAFVLLQDSIIDVQAVRIDSLEAQKVRQWSDFNKLLDIQEEKFQAASEINLHLSAINDHYREENRKLKSKRFSVGPGVNVGLRGPDVSFGVQYSLFRF